MIDLWTIIQKTVLKCSGCFAVIVVNTGFVTFSLCTECFGKLPAERADTALMIGEKLIFCAFNAVFVDWAGVCVEFFIHSDHLLLNCYIQYITVEVR